MLGGIAKLAGKYFAKDGVGRQVAKDVGIQSGISGLLGLATGGPVAGLAYGLGDFATNLPLVGLARHFSPGVKGTLQVKDATDKLISKPYHAPSAIEQGVNLGASLLSPVAVDMVTGGRLFPQVTPTVVSQEQQLYHQGLQFQTLNNGATQSIAQGTRFQLQGLPERVTSSPVPGIDLLPEQQAYLAEQMKHLQY
jgi:hypothetical protein